jgi:decaprenylphospho-beta-D-erythro-pentofuranosid-2-ulose 2-reductase
VSKSKAKVPRREKDEPSQHIMIFGASSGIAMEFARLYAPTKARFTLIARDSDKLKDISDDLFARGAKDVAMVAYSLDSLQGSFEATRDIVRQTEAPDIVLIAHGLLETNDALLKSAKAMNRLLKVNIHSPIGMLMALEDEMAARKGGVIAVISSVAGDRGRASNFAYGSTKAAITAFVSGLRARLRPRGVHVITVKPGMVDTAMTEHLPRSPLMAHPNAVARDIVKAIIRKKAVVYTPGFWRLIMYVIVRIPENLFLRLKF